MEGTPEAGALLLCDPEASVLAPLMAKASSSAWSRGTVDHSGVFFTSRNVVGGGGATLFRKNSSEKKNERVCYC